MGSMVAVKDIDSAVAENEYVSNLINLYKAMLEVDEVQPRFLAVALKEDGKIFVMLCDESRNEVKYSDKMDLEFALEFLNKHWDEGMHIVYVDLSKNVDAAYLYRQKNLPALENQIKKDMLGLELKEDIEIGM